MVAKSSLDIESIAKKTKRKIETFAQELTQDLAKTAIERTPVKTGNLRGHWFTTINQPTASFEGAPDISGQQTIARITLTINQMQIGDTISVLNGAEYAEHLEFGTQYIAPRAFVRRTVNDAPAIAQRTAARIAKT